MGCGSSVQQVKYDPWDVYDWDSLPQGYKQHWEVLGFNRASWNGNIPEPRTTSMRWSELSAAERNSASALGYNQRMWDNGEEPSMLPPPPAAPQQPQQTKQYPQIYPQAYPQQNPQQQHPQQAQNARFCPKCGGQAGMAQNFCNSCGQQLGAAPPAPSNGPGAPPGYVPTGYMMPNAQANVTNYQHMQNANPGMYNNQYAPQHQQRPAGRTGMGTAGMVGAGLAGGVGGYMLANGDMSGMLNDAGELMQDGYEAVADGMEDAGEYMGDAFDAVQSADYGGMMESAGEVGVCAHRRGAALT
eukprot:760812-Hanusia_phi.AAC.8